MEDTKPKTLREEIALVEELRSKEGLTYIEIANKLNKSLSWVYTRSNQKYRPVKNVEEKKEEAIKHKEDKKRESIKKSLGIL